MLWNPLHVTIPPSWFITWLIVAETSRTPVIPCPNSGTGESHAVASIKVPADKLHAEIQKQCVYVGVYVCVRAHYMHIQQGL